MVQLCVRIEAPEQIPLAREAGADGVVVAASGLRAPAERAGLPVAALPLTYRLPHETTPLMQAESPPSLVYVPAPCPDETDLVSMEAVKEFRLACIDALRRAGLWAERSGCILGVVSGIDTFFHGSLEVCELIRAAGSPAVRWVMNTFDAEASGEGISGATDVGGDLLAHILAEDSLDGGRVAPGQGNVPFGRLFEQLEFLGYEGAVEVVSPPDTWAEALEVLRRARG